MKRNILFYILPFLSLLAISCNEDYVQQGASGATGEGSMYLSLEVDVPEFRTRAIDMTPGAPLYLENIWVGVFRQSDGALVGGTSEPIEYDHRMTASGVKLLNMVQIEGYNNGTVSSDDKFCVVGVANINPDLKTLKINSDGQVTEGEDLLTELQNVESWSDFIGIAVKTEEGFIDNTPLLMGYLHPEDVDQTTSGHIYTKVDQLSNGVGINLQGTGTGDDWWITGSVSGNKLSALNTEGKVLKLRRLRSKINVNIETGDGIVITDLKYKVMNAPKSSFLAQRRTITDPMGNNGDKTYSPNSADMQTDGYTDDTEWNVPSSNGSFSYEHFENKHWAQTNANWGNQYEDQYHARELHEGDPLTGEATFLALVDKDNSTHWNNNASYMIIHMNIRDEKTGKNGEIDYVVHEGFINDADGVVSSDLNTRLKDFSCIRNTDYNYNITVNGIESIFTQVILNSTLHPNDQFGQIWNMWYITDGDTNQVVVERQEHEINIDDIQNYNTYLYQNFKESLKSKENFAFRLIGNFPGATNYDICYNFSRGDLDGFADLWQDPVGGVTEYFIGTGSEGEDNYISKEDALKNYFDANSSDKNLESLLNSVQIKLQGQEYKNIKDIIEYLKDLTTIPDIASIKYVKPEGYPTDKVDNPKDYLLALYIFDIKEAMEGKNTDKDGCKNYPIYACEQYPQHDPKVYLKTVNFSASDMIYTGSFYNMLDYDNSHWTGGHDVVTELFWKHRDGIKSYTVTVDKPGENATDYDSYTLTSDKFDKYIKEYNGQQIMAFPFTTPRLSPYPKLYSLIIDVEYEDGYTGPAQVNLPNALKVNTNNKSVWNFTDSPWSDISNDMFNTSTVKTVCYDGLIINQSQHNSQKMPTHADQASNKNKYICFGGKGSQKDRNFCLYLFRKEKIKVYVTNSGSSADASRQISLYQEGITDPIQTSTGGLSADDVEKNGVDKLTPIEFEVYPQEPTRYYISCNNNCRYFKIELERQ